MARMAQRWIDELHSPSPSSSDTDPDMNSSSEFPSVAGQLLVAMPSLIDPHFGGSVIYVAEHTARGAMGIVVNRPADMNLGSLFSRIDLSLSSPQLSDMPVFVGGPVQTDRGFVLHEPLGKWSSTLPISTGLGLTSSRDILEAAANGRGPERFLVSLGYSGWAAGQLDSELAANAWLTVPMSQTALLFDTPAEDRLGAAFRMLGVDPLNLSGAVGHA
jgi:putative transcriptional regulator